MTAYSRNLKINNVKAKKLTGGVAKTILDMSETKIVIPSIYMREKREENYDKWVEMIDKK